LLSQDNQQTLWCLGLTYYLHQRLTELLDRDSLSRKPTQHSFPALIQGIGEQYQLCFPPPMQGFLSKAYSLNHECPRLTADVLIVQVTGGPDRDPPVVVVAAPLRARITRQSVDELQLVPGRAVFAVVKSVSFNAPGFGARQLP